MCWIKEIEIKDGDLKIEHGYGIEEMFADRLKSVLELPTTVQQVFWRSFSKGFGQKLSLRPQDAKAFRTYLFLTITWPQVQKCSSIRELYGRLFRTIAAEPCPDGVDPVDFEERQFKWFEKLCHRNLGLSLRPKGRPKREK